MTAAESRLKSASGAGERMRSSVRGRVRLAGHDVRRSRVHLRQAMKEWARLLGVGVPVGGAGLALADMSFCAATWSPLMIWAGILLTSIGALFCILGSTGMLACLAGLPLTPQFRRSRSRRELRAALEGLPREEVRAVLAQLEADTCPETRRLAHRLLGDLRPVSTELAPAMPAARGNEPSPAPDPEERGR